MLGHDSHRSFRVIPRRARSRARTAKRPRTRSHTVQAGGLWLRYRRTQPGVEYGITRGRGREDVPDMLGG